MLYFGMMKLFADFSFIACCLYSVLTKSSLFCSEIAYVTDVNHVLQDVLSHCYDVAVLYSIQRNVAR